MVILALLIIFITAYEIRIIIIKKLLKEGAFLIILAIMTAVLGIIYFKNSYSTSFISIINEILT